MVLLESCLQTCMTYTTAECYNRPVPLLAHSVRMKPNFQGLPWFKCYGLGEDELLTHSLPAI